MISGVPAGAPVMIEVVNLPQLDQNTLYEIKIAKVKNPINPAVKECWIGLKAFS